ncbi:DUF559 domain-containing protein [Mycobacterium sp. Y57]|uniref:endonuclease domain-containing protein n=1 Tax=Mycolicibacterium xanthum TaxID=2796469 RepID=UPI001C8421E3|nr:DUF559 domain-containing protein [Mycolicibacterium xanthum]MBX7434575.1 DUF559 domain-containing protein [Mycolicibacterium xanthum]
MTTAIHHITRNLIEQHGLPTGTSLENRVTWRLHTWDILDQTQYRVGKYRLDYAWPTVRIALEADGPHHWRPDVAVKDVARDAWLRSQGWLVFRVDDSDTLDEQLCRVVRMIRAELDGGA